MSGVPGSVLVVGASAAGLGVAEALRHKGFEGQLTILGAEAHLPYDRPPLSKQVLAGTWDTGRVLLRKQEQLDELKAQFILGDPAVSLDTGRHLVRTACGRALRADAVVIATGLRARTMPGGDGLSGVHVLRSLHDALGLRTALEAAVKQRAAGGAGPRIVVVGDGVLGAEIAATAAGLDLDVTMTGPQNAPLEMQFGALVSGLLADLHSGHGVTLRLGTGVDRVTGSGGPRAGGDVTGVRLTSGEVIPADLVVVSVGGIPETGWLEGSGLEISNGVVCDSACRALRSDGSGPAGGVYAAGDVARWHHEHLGTTIRLENRTNATESAWAVAAAITGDDEPYAPVPYMWTDQHGVKIQVHGHLSADADVDITDGDPEIADENGKRRFVARYRKDGRVVGVLGWNMPKQTRQRRQELVESFASPANSPAQETPS